MLSILTTKTIQRSSHPQTLTSRRSGVHDLDTNTVYLQRNLSPQIRKDTREKHERFPDSNQYHSFAIFVVFICHLFPSLLLFLTLLLLSASSSSFRLALFSFVHFRHIHFLYETPPLSLIVQSSFSTLASSSHYRLKAFSFFLPALSPSPFHFSSPRLNNSSSHFSIYCYSFFHRSITLCSPSSLANSLPSLALPPSVTLTHLSAIFSLSCRDSSLLTSYSRTFLISSLSCLSARFPLSLLFSYLYLSILFPHFLRIFFLLFLELHFRRPLR